MFFLFLVTTLLFALASFPNLAQGNRTDLASHFGNEYKIYEIWQKTGDGRSNSDFRPVLNGKVKVIQFQWVERPLFLGVGKIRHTYMEPRSCANVGRIVSLYRCVSARHFFVRIVSCHVELYRARHNCVALGIDTSHAKIAVNVSFTSALVVSSSAAGEVTLCTFQETKIKCSDIMTLNIWCFCNL